MSTVLRPRGAGWWRSHVDFDGAVSHAHLVGVQVVHPRLPLQALLQLEPALDRLGDVLFRAHVVVDRPAEVGAAADVELGVVQRAGDDPALERAIRDRRVLVAAAAAHSVDGAIVLAQADLTVVLACAHVLHAAGGDVLELRYFVPHDQTSSGGNWGRLSGSVTSWWTKRPHQQRFILSKCSRWNGMHGQQIRISSARTPLRPWQGQKGAPWSCSSLTSCSSRRSSWSR